MKAPGSSYLSIGLADKDLTRVLVRPPTGDGALALLFASGEECPVDFSKDGEYTFSLPLEHVSPKGGLALGVFREDDPDCDHMQSTTYSQLSNIATAALTGPTTKLVDVKEERIHKLAIATPHKYMRVLFFLGPDVLLTGGHGGQLVAWSIPDGKRKWQRTFGDQSGQDVTGADLAANGTLVVSTRRRVLFLSSATGDTRAKLYEVPDGVFDEPEHVTFSPDGTGVVFASQGGLHMLDARKGNPRAQFGFRVSPIEVEGIAFSEDGKLLASLYRFRSSAEDSYELMLWDTQAKRTLCSIPVNRHEGSLHSLRFVQRDTVLYLADAGGVTLYDVQGRKETGKVVDPEAEVGDYNPLTGQPITRKNDPRHVTSNTATLTLGGESRILTATAVLTWSKPRTSLFSGQRTSEMLVSRQGWTFWDLRAGTAKCWIDSTLGRTPDLLCVSQGEEWVAFSNRETCRVTLVRCRDFLASIGAGG